MSKSIALKELRSFTQSMGGFRTGTITEITYECPCGNGKVYYENDDIIGHKHRDITTDCRTCNDKYEFRRGFAIEK